MKCLATLAACALAPPAAAAPPERSAAAFTDSVGVNVHLFYSDTPYRDSGAVRARLQELGVRHVRDGLAPNRPDQLAAIRHLHAAGIRHDLLLGAPGQDPWPLLRVVRDQLGGAIEALEGPNEYWSTGPGWQRRLVPFQRHLYTSVKADPRLARLTLVGSSVGDVDLSRSLDVGNLHPYPGGGPPEANLAQELGRAARVSGTKPVWATETGYHGALQMKRGSHQPATTDAAQAVYLPRLFAAYFAAGIPRTYAYELLDQFPDPGLTDPERHYGLLDHRMMPKPQFHALRRLLSATGDLRRGPKPSVLAPQVEDAGSGLRQLLLAHSDGTSRLLLWRAEPVGSDGRALRSPRSVTVRLGEPTALRLSDPTWNRDRELAPAATLRVIVGPALKVLRIGRPASPSASRRRTRRS